jgi:hypothetical protein
MWLTVPIVHKEGQLINEVKPDGLHWQKEHWKSIAQNYNNTPHFKNYRGMFETIYKHEWERLVDLNITLIKEIAILLNIKMPQIIKSSEMTTSGEKTDRLIPILKAVNCDTYISGVAAKDYLEVKKLNDAGIEVRWFEYQHPVYPQKGKFIPYLSAIDLLFNVGGEAIDYIRQGVNLVKA